MERGTYSPKQLADLAGVSVRTLHHYDRIGLLVADRLPNGYRVYGPDQVNRLQAILLYRATGMPLEDIEACLAQPDVDARSQLLQQRERLLERRRELDALVATVDKTIASLEGNDMTDEEKFEGLKRALVEENEKTYGAEARAAYGDEAVDASNAKLMGMTSEQYERTCELQQQIAESLVSAMETHDPASPEAQRVCDLHRQWLCVFWKEGTYTKQAHAGLAQMYVADERFKAHYDAIAPGAAEFLRDAISVYCAE